MNKQQIKNKMIKLGLKTNWQHFWTMLIMFSILIVFSVISWFLFLEALSAPILPYNEQNIESGIIYHNEQENTPEAKILPNKAYTETTARITCYKATGNLTASGKVPKNGMVAVSDRSIPFGTEIEIDGQTYIVEDRTAKWVFTDFEHLTVDIFLESGCDLNFGADKKLIIIK